MSSFIKNDLALQNSNETSMVANVSTNVETNNSNDNANINTNELDENDNYYCDQDDEPEYYEEYDCNYDDDHNNNNYLEDDENENDLYLNNPEYFEYEAFPLEQIDIVIEKKCQRVISFLKFEDPLDSIFILKKFNWNTEKIYEEFKKDNLAFLKTYFSDDDNNNNSKTRYRDKLQLTSYINIFNENNNSTIFKDMKLLSQTKSLISSKSIKYCDICCMSRQCNEENGECDMFAINECLHYFCIYCWGQHFESLINFGTFLTSRFECMQAKCNSIASKEFVLKCLNFKRNCSEINNYTLSSFKDYPERYKQMISVDLVKESDDLQMCPGDSLVNNGNIFKNSATPSTPLVKASAIASVANIASTMPLSADCSPKAINSTLHNKHQSSSIFSTPSYYSTLLTTKLNRSMLTDKNYISSQTKKCNYVVWAKSKPAARRVLCTYCSTQYCFLCSLPYHAPNGCETIRKWNLKCQDDSETRNYLLVHTQDCPKCKVCIEKNGGCSHMTCNRCKNEFCWGD